MTIEDVIRQAVAEELARHLSPIRAQLERIQGEEWLTIPQACERLECSRSTLDRKIKAGQIEARGAGKTRMVRMR